MSDTGRLVVGCIMLTPFYMVYWKMSIGKYESLELTIRLWNEKMKNMEHFQVYKLSGAIYNGTSYNMSTSSVD